MVWIAILLLVIAVLALLATIFTQDEEVKNGSLLALIAAGCLGVILFIASTITIVDSGHVGVKVTFGSVSDEAALPEGLHFVNPFANVKELSVRTENYRMSHQEEEGARKGDDSVKVRASNGLQMPVDVSVPYRLNPDSAAWVYQNLGSNYVEKLLRPALSTATQRAGGHYTAEELYSTKRDEFSQKVKELMGEELRRILLDNYKDKNPPENVILTSQVLVGHIGIPDSVKHAIESKLKADQEQQAMEFTIMREKKEAERKRVEAEGIQTFQNIVSKGIDDKLLKWKGIEATLKLAESQNAKIIIIGAGKDGLPVLLGQDGNVQVQSQK
jgi:regulator of protease activity HflC (stomatin/prohibitin superfamily)